MRTTVHHSEPGDYAGIVRIGQAFSCLGPGMDLLRYGIPDCTTNVNQILAARIGESRDAAQLSEGTKFKRLGTT